MKTFGEICSAISDSYVSSVADLIWTIIRYLWPWYGLGIIFVLGIWIIFQVTTRYSSTSFRSKNGFTPNFNRFVGSGTYLLLQTIVFLILTTMFGDLVYCYKWPIVLHIFIFYFTHQILKSIGFWVY